MFKTSNYRELQKNSLKTISLSPFNLYEDVFGEIFVLFPNESDSRLLILLG